MVRYVSIDVECAATGPGHNDRAPCWIGLVDHRECVLFDAVVKVENCFSPLTEITGLTKEDIDAGDELEEAVLALRMHLGPDVVIVGQKIDHDIAWLGLENQVDYDTYIDIAVSFRTWNHRYKNWNYFSLREEAYCLLNLTMNPDHHDPTEDAKVSIRLFQSFVLPDGRTLQEAAQKLMWMRYRQKFPQFLKSQRKYMIDGVCCAKFRPSECVCGQPHD